MIAFLGSAAGGPLAAIGLASLLIGGLGLLIVVVLGLVLVGRETARLAVAARPAVFELAEAVDYVADRLSPDAQARLSHDDVRWILLTDADLLEEATEDPTEGRYPWSHPEVDPDELERTHLVDEDVAVARLLRAAERADRDVADVDVAEVLALRMRYLEAIGAVGGMADDVDGGPPAADGT